MSQQRPLADQTVSKSVRLGLWGWVVVVVALGIVVLGARSLAGLFRGLDQGASTGAPAERPAR